GLTVSVLIGNPVWDEVDDTSILTTGRQPLSTISILVTVLGQAARHRKAIAQRFSALARPAHPPMSALCPLMGGEAVGLAHEPARGDTGAAAGNARTASPFARCRPPPALPPRPLRLSPVTRVHDKLNLNRRHGSRDYLVTTS